jgi:hypothetical protein
MKNLEPSHIAIGVIVILGIVVLYFMFVKKPVKNEGIVNESVEDEITSTDVNDVIDKLNAAEIESHPIEAESEDINQDTLNKLNWKNQAPVGHEVTNSYAQGVRGQTDINAWNDFFNDSSDLIDKSYIQTNDKFIPIDETRGDYATYSGKGQTKHSPDDLFKVDKLLPQEVKSDWFEVMPEPIKVKNRHLVNITRPVGVNTIGSSLKNPSYDIRGNIPVAKMVVSPWMQSSIDPDLNTKGLC